MDIGYETIVRAVHGNIDALEAVLAYYEREINILSTHPFITEGGRTEYACDDNIKHMLQSKLTAAILRFKLDN